MQNPLKIRVTTEINYWVKAGICLFYLSCAAFAAGLIELAIFIVRNIFQ